MRRLFFSVCLIALFFMLWISGCVEESVPGEDLSVPVIDKMTAIPAALMIDQTSVITVEARSLRGESLSYVWQSLDGGVFEGDVTWNTVTWRAPSVTGVYRIRCRVSSASGKYSADTIQITVQSHVRPVMNILYPRNGDFISAGLSGIYIQFDALPKDEVDTLRCYINGTHYQTLHKPALGYRLLWGISELNGPYVIKFIGVTDYFTPGIWHTDSTAIAVSIEGGIGKHNK